MSKDRAVGKNGGDFAIVCKSCGIPVLQDKECMTKLSNLLLDIDLFVYTLYLALLARPHDLHTIAKSPPFLPTALSLLMCTNSADNKLSTH